VLVSLRWHHKLKMQLHERWDSLLSYLMGLFSLMLMALGVRLANRSPYEGTFLGIVRMLAFAAATICIGLLIWFT
jgi:hypothetical protein